MNKKVLSTLLLLLSCDLLLMAQSGLSKPFDLIKKGDIALSKKSLSTAITYYTTAINLQPDYSEEIYIKRGNVYAEIDSAYKAIADFSEAIQLNPESALAYNNRALTYLELQDYQRAIEDQKKVLQINSKDPLAYSNMALIYAKAGQYVQSIETYTQAIEIDKTNHLFYYNRADAYYKNKQIDQALLDLTTALTIKNSFTDANQYRADIYMELGKWDKAEADYSVVLKKTKTFSNLVKRAYCYQSLKQYNMASIDYTACLSMEPGNLNVRFRRGLCFYQSKTGYNNAVKDFSILMEREPNNQVALLYRGKAYTELKMYDLAQVDFRRLIAEEPRVPVTYYEIAYVHFLKQEYPQALKFLNTCVALEKDNDEAYFLKARIYVNTNQPALASNEIDVALQINSTDKRYQDLKKKIQGLLLRKQ